MMTRRNFIQLSGATAGGIALAPHFSFAQEKPKPLRILILGGTGFTGPYQVKYAVERGHQVTVFNRGKTHKSEMLDGVEQLVGDRNGQLGALRGNKWDVCIDNPTMLPAWVRDAAAVLQGNIDRYIFTSTISVYGDPSKPVDESAPVAKYEGVDPYKETLETVKASEFKLYGPLKALSEQEAEKSFPGKTLIIRPGLIVGPGDESDRFTYWPVRIHRGGEVLAPGEKSDPVQIIDARDLAEWTIRMAESSAHGTYNATGPAHELTISGMLEGIKTALHATDAKFTWIDAAFLEQQKVAPWSDMPVGVVGAIATNLGATATDKTANVSKPERTFMFVTFLIMAAIEISLLITKPNARYFAFTILAVGLVLRGLVQERRARKATSASTKNALTLPTAPFLTATEAEHGRSILCAIRSKGRTLDFALREARETGRRLYLLFVREQRFMTDEDRKRKWPDDAEAREIFDAAKREAGGRACLFNRNNLILNPSIGPRSGRHLDTGEPEDAAVLLRGERICCGDHCRYRGNRRRLASHSGSASPQCVCRAAARRRHSRSFSPAARRD